ncbi:MAG: thioredoxin [Lachnospiraceae bacterium]|nr:thioredoxin [Lachnospiraceae bacterium]
MVKNVSSSDFDELVLKAEKPVLVDFYADWCGPCKMMSPLIDELSEEYKNSFDFYKLNTDEAGDIAQRYKIMSIPTLIIFKDGSPEKTIVGAQPRKALEAELSRY